MYWIEICTDGSYVHDGREYPLLIDHISPQESIPTESSDDGWEKYTLPYEIETEHGVFAWEVEIIEYVELGVASCLGYQLTEHPAGILLKDEVMFRMQDGWAYPNKPRST